MRLLFTLAAVLVFAGCDSALPEIPFSDYYTGTYTAAGAPGSTAPAVLRFGGGEDADGATRTDIYFDEGDALHLVGLAAYSRGTLTVDFPGLDTGRTSFTRLTGRFSSEGLSLVLTSPQGDRFDLRYHPR